MIQGLEYTCNRYPHIEETLHKLKLDIQKANYLNSLLVGYRTETAESRKYAELHSDRRSRRQGFEIQALDEMFAYLEKLDVEGRFVDHTFTLS
ncbi:MAG: hypothetical protein Q9N32_08815 [Gammaproteobacteria bacterium]|nr:hypothetical protein [Gammaproteobacteria bacterium]